MQRQILPVAIDLGIHIGAVYVQQNGFSLPIGGSVKLLLIGGKAVLKVTHPSSSNGVLGPRQV